jgi:UDPglucose--hexose-1-phosphate uridylyltransferase
MITTLEFRKEIKQGRYYDPRRNFELSTIASEIRYDPLTGDSGRICHFTLTATVPPDLQELAARTAVNCPFCPENVLRVTPRFPENLLPEGRLQYGGAVLFPNLFPYDDISAVAAISERHFLSLEDIPIQVIEDGVGIAREFFRRIEIRCRDETEPGYGIVTWNYLPPAGGTQVHPHIQVTYTSNPGNRLRRELAAEYAYREHHGCTYLAELLAAEREEGVRWLGTSGSVQWYVPFTPTGLLGDCVGVFPERATLSELSDRDIRDCAEGLQRVLRGFSTLGLWSFNLTFFPDRHGASAASHWLNVRVVPRLYLNPVTHVPDVSHLQLLLEEHFAMAYPEETAARLRTVFENAL